MTDINWSQLLADADVESLWNALYQLVSRHPSTRPLHFATDGAAVASAVEINADLTQELFLELFQKQRFDHYLDQNYSSTEIENELAHIEIPNLVGARLRKRYPESFRLARRVSSLLKTSSRVRRFDIETEEPPANGKTNGKSPARRGRPAKRAVANSLTASLTAGAEGDEVDLFDDSFEEDESAPTARRSGKNGRRRMVNQVYGLRKWLRSKGVKDSGHFEEMAKSVPMRRRDTRIVGRSGSSQLIISNPELEDLIVEILEAIDSPADVRTLRQLTLSKIPLQDYNIASLDEPVGMGNDGVMVRRDAPDLRETPESALLREEQNEQAAEMAEEFLNTLRRAVNNNERRYVRLVSTLWHCYYNPDGPSQLEIAALLGVSDSLVSDNRRLIEHHLRSLNLSVEDGLVFNESLQHLLTETHTAQ